MIDAQAPFNPFDLEVSEGVKVRDLKSRADCANAIDQIEARISDMLSQIGRSEADPEYASNRPGWRTRVQGAIRWNKQVRRAIVRWAEKLPREVVPAREQRAQILLEVFRDELGNAEFDRIRDIARSRYPAAFSEATL